MEKKCAARPGVAEGREVVECGSLGIRRGGEHIGVSQEHWREARIGARRRGDGGEGLLRFSLVFQIGEDRSKQSLAFDRLRIGRRSISRVDRPELRIAREERVHRAVVGLRKRGERRS